MQFVNSLDSSSKFRGLPNILFLERTGRSPRRGRNNATIPYGSAFAHMLAIYFNESNLELVLSLGGGRGGNFDGHWCCSQKEGALVGVGDGGERKVVVGCLDLILL
ncbi:unnamed protein product [Prunus armeniaca]|uniref:Uncharacterized protein n=1 Tax=Prunus armeniaca TaxID=36596 RepID=A0A6J5TWH4_PRUAR|nr:unnamed protein product [Prunus armeniaca]